MKQPINPRFVVLLTLISVVAVVRIVNSAEWSPVTNFTPIGAMALFGGAYFEKRWKALLFPLLTLFVSDLVINVVLLGGQYGVMYKGWYWIYGIFALIVVYGNVLIQKVSVRNVVLAALVASVSHWVLADTSVWLSGGLDLRTGLPLSRDFSGWWQCLVQGIPFMRNFLAGTLAYGAVLFGGFEWLQMRFPKLAVA
ncbi:MAG: hypothetical protein H7Z72_03385 [Bacteroidetes bacterium]|nr:hypothetical protein [Fibrella sp.]